MSTTTAGGRKGLAFVGICIIAFMAMFLMSGVGTYAYTVAAAFDSVASVGMVFTLESVLRTVMIPLSGKIGDLLGRKKLFIFAVAVYIIAYLVASLATSFWMFTIARTITGFAWGLFVINAMTLVSDVFGQEEAPKYAGISQAITTVAMILGAPVAGIFCAFNWRVEFFVVLPIMAVGLIFCIIGLPRVPVNREGGGKMDVGGCVFTAIMLVPFSLAMNWGNTYGWGSPLVLALLAITVVGLICLLLVERKATSPLYPAKLLKNKYFLSVFMISFAYSFASGAGMYVPTFAQYVLGASSTVAGFITLPGLIVATILSAVLGRYASKAGKYRGMTWAWTLLTLVWAIALLFLGKVMLLGLGAALIYTIIITIPSSAVNGIQQIVPYTYPMKVLEPKDLAVGMAFMGLGGPLGTTISTGVCGALMNSSGGMISMFYTVPIILAVVMVIFTFMFRDIKQGETIA